MLSDGTHIDVLCSGKPARTLTVKSMGNELDVTMMQAKNDNAEDASEPIVALSASSLQADGHWRGRWPLGA